MITEDDIRRMVDLIVEKFRPEKIILFGSYARGEATEDSDVDLLIVAGSRVPRYERAIPVYRMLRTFPTAVDVLVYTPEEVREWSTVDDAFVSRAVAEGRVLYEKSA